MPLIRDELRRLVGKAEQRPGPDPLWRLGEALERGGTDGGRERDGALVGGASLVAADFLGIAGAYLRVERCEEAGLRAFDPARTPMLQAAATYGFERPAPCAQPLEVFGTMQTVLIIIHLIIVLALIGVVLLQRSEGGGWVSAAAAAACPAS